MNAVLEYVPTSRVREYWPRIRDQVAALSEIPGEDWIAEDVFHALMLGDTHLFTTADVRGFFVTQVLSNPYSRTLHVWLASNVGGDWTGALFEQLKDLARTNDCSSITFRSDRTGWKRVLPGVRATLQYSYDLGDD